MTTARLSTESRDERMLHASLLMLTFVAGLVDAASFLGMGHMFLANMTGNIVFMSLAAVGVPELSFIRSAVAFVVVSIGGSIAGYLDACLFWNRRNDWLAFAMGLQALLLTLSAAAAHTRIQQQLGQEWAIWAVILSAGTSMGIRNGTMRCLAMQDPTSAATELSPKTARTEGLNPGWSGRAASNLLMFSGVACGALLLRYSLCAVLASGATVTVGCVVLQLIREETDREAKRRMRIS